MCCSPRVCKELDMTEQMKRTDSSCSCYEFTDLEFVIIHLVRYLSIVYNGKGELPRWLSGKKFACKQETRVGSLSREDPLEKEMAIHSSILAWEIPWTEESGRLQSMESQKYFLWYDHILSGAQNC